MCRVASLIVRKLWGVTQIWSLILVRLWKTFRTAFSVCLYRLFEVSYGCLNIWYTHVWVASLIVKTVRCDADLIDDSCEALKDLSNGVFRMSLSTFWGELWLFEYMGVISHVWSCLTNCEKTVRCDADLIDDSCEALKDLSNGVFRMSLSTFWGELWLFEYMGVMSHVWSCLTNCEKTVRCDADLIDDSCEALKDLSNGVFRMSLSTFWGELWLFEYMGDIHMCGVASLIVRKLWGVTQIWLMILVRLWKTFRTAFSVCLYRLFEVSYGCLNIWVIYTCVELPH